MHFAAAVLLKIISANAETIKRWAILASGATSHFLITNTPATNICTASARLVARLPNGERVQLAHTCTLDLPELPAAARNAHIIPGLALHFLLSVVAMCNAGCFSPSPRLDAPSCIVDALLSAATNARALASGWSRSSKAIQIQAHRQPQTPQPQLQWLPTSRPGCLLPSTPATSINSSAPHRHLLYFEHLP
jgi:hypothetical protein